MATITLYRAMVARIVTVIRSEVSIHHVNDRLDNVIVNQALLGSYEKTKNIDQF